MTSYYPALGDAYRNIVVTQGLTSETATAHTVDAQFNLDAGFGISLVTDVPNNKVTIVNTGNGTGSLTRITNTNSLGTFYPIFTRAPDDTMTFVAGTIPPNDYVTADVPMGVSEIRITGSINDENGITYELRTAITELVGGEPFQGVKVSDSATLNFTAAGPATYSVINGYWTVPINSANLSTETLSSITLSTGTGNINPITGTYQMDTMYLDQTDTPLTYNPNTSTISVTNLSGTSFTMTGHVTLEGVTSTGATGTGKFVFDTSPTLVTPVLGTPQSGNFSTGTFTWPTFDQNTTGYAANLSGGNNTTLLGSVHYQSDVNVTTQLAPNTTTTKKFLRQTGDGTNGAAPTWDTVTATDVGLGNVTNESKATMFTSPTFTGTVSGVTATHVGLGNVTNESKATMFTSPTFTGHPTIEGVTSTGGTGTGNFVFDTSPTLITPILGTPQSGNFSTGTFTWPTFNQNTSGYAANLSGGNNTTLLGSVHYQSDSNVTTQLAPNTTTTKKFLRQTGDGTNGAAPAWDTVTATDVGLGDVTNESKATMFTSPTFTGHATIEGQTLTGVTGTGKLVLDASPTVSGTLSVSSGNTNATQYTACSSTAGNTMSEVGQKTASVSTGATIILATPAYMTFAMITGTDGTNRFSDLVLMSVGTGTVNVISSLSAGGTPAARTYSQSASTLRLAMASGTYTVSVYAFTMTP